MNFSWQTQRRHKVGHSIAKPIRTHVAFITARLLLPLVVRWVWTGRNARNGSTDSTNKQQQKAFPGTQMFFATIAFPIRVAMSQEIMLMQSARGQRCCPCPQHSPSEQHMLTMISKDVCWAVSKAVASLSSSLPLWTKTCSHVSQHPSKAMTVSTVITQSSDALPQRRD